MYLLWIVFVRLRLDNLVEHDEKNWLPYSKIERMHEIKNRIGSLVATCHFLSNLTNLDS